MKRCWFGLALLVVILAISLAVTWGMDVIHRPIAQDLLQAAECAQFGDWDNAGHYSKMAEENWKKWEHFRACFADHTPVEEISAELAAIAQSRAAREKAGFASACARAAEMVQAVGNAHGLYWWNLL